MTTSRASAPLPPTLACPITGEEARHFCDKEEYGRTWHIYRARPSGHGFVANPPDAEFLAEMYGSYPGRPPVSEAELRERFAIRVDSRVLAEVAARVWDELNQQAPAGWTMAERYARGEVLDVGCGSGPHSWHFAHAGFCPTMLDVYDEAKQLEGLLPGAKWVGGHFEGLTLEGLGRSRPFEAVLMSHVLEHSPDPLGWLRRAREMLAPRGVLVVAVPNFGGVYRLLGSRDPYLYPPQHLHYFTARSLRVAMEASGLRVVHEETRSEIPLKSTRGRTRWPRVAAAKVWNRIAWTMRQTRWGIHLRLYATPA